MGRFVSGRRNLGLGDMLGIQVGEAAEEILDCGFDARFLVNQVTVFDFQYFFMEEGTFNFFFNFLIDITGFPLGRVLECLLVLGIVFGGLRIIVVSVELDVVSGERPVDTGKVLGWVDEDFELFGVV